MTTRTFPTAATSAFAAVALFLGTGIVGLPGCERSAPSSTSPSTASSAGSPTKRPPEKVYTVRGRIVMLPVTGRPSTELVIHHEAINDFVNPNGRVGMSSMEMPMPPDPSVSLADLAVGDMVEFDLSVWYTPKFASIESYRVTRVKKLPADTQLKFGPAAPTPGAGNP